MKKNINIEANVVNNKDIVTDQQSQPKLLTS